MGVYGRFAQRYDLIYKGIVNYKQETDAFEKLFKKFCKKRPMTILDVGCGRAHILFFFQNAATLSLG